MTVAEGRDEVRARLVGVAARLLHEHGTAGVTTRGVAEAGGVQAPTLYRLFGDKDGLLDAVAEHVLATYVATKADVVDVATADGVDPWEDLRAGWHTHVDFGLANPALFRLLQDPDRAARSPAARAGHEVLAARVHRVAGTGRLRVGEDRAVALLHAAGTGLVLTLLATPPDSRDPGLPGAMYDAVLAQLVDGGPAADGGDPLAAAAVTLRAAAPELDPLTPAERQLLAEWLDRVVDRVSDR